MQFDQTLAQKIVIEGDVTLLVESAQKIGEDISRQLTTSQIRNIFGEVRRIEMAWNSDPNHAFRQSILLIPKLVYQGARERGRGVSILSNALTLCLTELKHSPKQDRQLYFSRFVDFFEAILAYHKAAGGV